MGMPNEHTLTPAIYQRMLIRFVETGEQPDAAIVGNDPLAVYLARTMADMQVQAAVLGNKLCGRIFLDMMTQFIALCLERNHYRLQRAGAELRQIAEARKWTLIRRNTGWHALVQMAAERGGETGFERGFFERKFGDGGKCIDDKDWSYFLDEWEENVRERLRTQAGDFIHERGGANDRLLRGNLQSIPQYVAAHGVSGDDFAQTWALMGGRWNTVEYERLARVARLQTKYPVLVDVANRMGRIADTQGRRRLAVSSGASQQLPTAAHSDIAGVTTGRDFGALLPSEMAQFLDPTLEDVFLEKYLTSQLQIFLSQSHAAHAARSLQTTPARPKGAMVVCCDTSGSMQGEPSQVALSLMMRLAELAAHQRRNCLLIAFATDARPIDVLRDRTQLLRFFTQRAAGGTDARAMLDHLQQAIATDPRYGGADVLWITDFRIPLPPKTYLAAIEAMRKASARFYGLQIGVADNRWLPHFDEMFKIADIKMPFT